MPGVEDLRFPLAPDFYSKFQTSRAWKLAIEFVLISSIFGVLFAVFYQYARSPSQVDWVIFAELLVGAGILAIIAIVIAIVRPFIVADGRIQLMRPVRVSKGVRRLVLSIDELANAELRPGEGRSVEVWVTLVDGTRFRMVTFDDDAGQDFARRFENYVRTLRGSPPRGSSDNS